MQFSVNLIHKRRQYIIHYHYLLSIMYLYLQVPCTVRFCGQGGMTAENYSWEKFEEVLRFQPDYVILTIGGNDIKSRSNPNEIARYIREIISSLYQNGVKKVFFTEICDRGIFKKDPHLTRKIFNKQRRILNELVSEMNVGIIDIGARLSRDYCGDKVHFNDDGHKKFFFSIRRAIFSVKKIPLC